MAAVPFPDRIFAHLLALLTRKRKEKPLTIWSDTLRWGVMLCTVKCAVALMVSPVSKLISEISLLKFLG
jgi:hypothetical protein